ncbi:MAG: protein usg [Pseudomonadota bacterium]
MTTFRDVLDGAVLTTAEILYRLPDHPSVLQTYLWQDYDLHPKFPKLKGFLEFWETNLDGKLFRVTVSHRNLVTPSEIATLDADFKLH